MENEEVSQDTTSVSTGTDVPVTQPVKVEIPEQVVSEVAETVEAGEAGSLPEQTEEQVVGEEKQEAVTQVEVPIETQPEPEKLVTPEPVTSVPNVDQPIHQPAEPIVNISKNKSLIIELLAKARAKIQLKKRLKLEKIMGLFAKKNKITNDQVEKLLHVSDSTATRYLDELEKENKITQNGKTGKGVVYTKN